MRETLHDAGKAGETSDHSNGVSRGKGAEGGLITLHLTRARNRLEKELVLRLLCNDRDGRICGQPGGVHKHSQVLLPTAVHTPVQRVAVEGDKGRQSRVETHVVLVNSRGEDLQPEGLLEVELDLRHALAVQDEVDGRNGLHHV